MIHRRSICPRITPSACRARPLRFETLEGRQLLAASTIQVDLAGATNTETAQLLIDEVPVATWTNIGGDASARTFVAQTYVHPVQVSHGQVRVAFTNDGLTGGGADRNLRVDAVSIDGQRFETEALSTLSTGTWRASDGCAPGNKQSEWLNCGGYFQYGATGSVVEVRAAGQTGTERIELQVDGAAVATFDNVGGDYGARVFESFSYTHPTPLFAGQIRVAFVNDGDAGGGADRNVRIDGITLDDAVLQAEDPSVFSVGAFAPGQVCQPGFHQTESLVCNGYFEFAGAGGGSTIEIRAAGQTGTEQIALQVDGATVATFDNVAGNYSTGSFQTFSYTHSTTLAADQVRVAFTNDGNTPGGQDRNVRVDGITLDGVVFESEAADVLSTGAFVAGVGCQPGLWQTEFLSCGGYLQFAASLNPGTIALGATLASVNEDDASVSIPVVRTGGSDGTVALNFTTVDGSATAGSDYTTTAGFAVLGPGVTTTNIVVPILDDGADEGNETFNVAGDLVVGGANLGFPRTATVTIVDDDGPPTPGDGNGLLGEYYDNIDFTGFVLERTDATVNFNWGQGSPAGGVGADTFSVRWTGEVEPFYNETYTFYSTADDGTRVWVNDVLIIDAWIDQQATTHTGAIALAGGVRHDIRVEYYENGGEAVQQLEWSSASQTRQVLPQSQLYSDEPAALDGSFSGQTIVNGLQGPVAVDFDSSGRMFIAEQRGVIKIYENGTLLPTPFLDIQPQVNWVQDRGVLGVAVHPNFPTTPYVYVSYTYDPPETANNSGLAGPNGSGNRVARLGRFTADPAADYATAIPGSEVVILGTNSTWENINRPDLDSTNNIGLDPSCAPDGTLQDCLPADSRSHTIGNVAFGNDGMLYVTNGDGTSFGQVDPRTTRVQDLDSLSGKLLRIDPITGAGLSDNPFAIADLNANRSKVVSYGLRNPFRFAFHPTTGEPFISDVGWNTFEEINAGSGQNFGWPFYEGQIGSNRQTGGYNSLPEAPAFYANNNASPPLWGRFHTAGAVAMVAGDFYVGSVYPTIVQDALFISDFGDNQIRAVRLNPDGSLKQTLPLNVSVGSIVEMSLHPNDGHMYYVDLGGRVGRLLFTPNAAASGSGGGSAGPTGSGAAAFGDFDLDGDADGRNLLDWQRGYGAAAGALAADGDATGEGAVADNDLLSWERNFGVFEQPAAAAAHAATPLVDSGTTWLAYDRLGVESAEETLEPDAVDEVLTRSTMPTALDGFSSWFDALDQWFGDDDGKKGKDDGDAHALADASPWSRLSD